MDIRMIAMDLDGTLKGRGEGIPEINCRALRACEARGIRLVFASGRAFEMLRPFAKQARINPLFAACNGARLEASLNGPTLSETTYDAARAQRICDLLLKSGMYFTAYTRGRVYLGNSQVRYSLGGYEHHRPHLFQDGDYVYEMVEDPSRLLSEGTVHPYKFVVLGEDMDPRFQEIQSKIEDMHMSISSSSRHSMEIMMPGTDKGAAVAFLAAREGISLSQVMAFGDHTNDLPMLNRVGWPVAMENGDDRVKAAARLIAPDHDAGGVGQLLEEYVLRT